MSDVRARAASWLSSQAMSHEACLARLRSIQNDAVNQQAQADVLRRMAGEVEVWRYLAALVERDMERAA